MSIKDFDVIVLGAGAAGLFAAIEAGKRKRRVCVLDHARKPAEKIRISGGGRCNFTNMYAHPSNFISENPHFCKSALKQYTQYDFIARVDEAGIAWHEKTLGQLFCDNSAKDIINMLLADCEQAGVQIQLETDIQSVKREAGRYLVSSSKEEFIAESLIVATGGLSIPKMGATGFAHKLAKQFGLNVITPRPGLVPFTFGGDELAHMAELSGVSVGGRVKTQRTAFEEGVLFTHRGLSGPAILQASSYWMPGEVIEIDLLPDSDLLATLKQARDMSPKKALSSVLTQILPTRLATAIADEFAKSTQMAALSNADLERVVARIQTWRLKPVGTEGYRTAEVTIGGVDTNDLSSQTMQARHVDGLYFIGEAVDVTGWLGGFNFQWAWSSGWVAGQHA